uniref:Uncharacterized protein n=1 Tax=Steinernema glaseri TaxID=37863 RepID=A0A1I7Y3B2_9BILA
MELPTQPSDSSSNEEEPLLNSRLYKSLSAIELSQYSSRSRCIEPILTASRSEWSLSYMNRNSCIQHLDMVDCMAMAEWHPLDQHYNNTFSDQAGTSVSPAENSLQTTNGTSSTLRMSAACSISIQKFNSDKEMFANMKATMVKTQQQMSSISKVSFVTVT